MQSEREREKYVHTLLEDTPDRCGPRYKYIDRKWKFAKPNRRTLLNRIKSGEKRQRGVEMERIAERSY